MCFLACVCVFVCYLLFTLIFGYQIEGNGVEGAGHDSEHAAEDQRGDDVGEEADEAGAHAKHKVAHKVQPLQTNVGQQEALHIWRHTHTQIQAHTHIHACNQEHKHMHPDKYIKTVLQFDVQ